MCFQGKNKYIALLLAAIMLVTSAVLADVSFAESTEEGTTLGFLVTGQDVKGTAGFQKNIIYLTEEENETMKAGKNPAAYGLGDCWASDHRYSSYDNHGTGGYHYSIADGLDVKLLLEHVTGSNFASGDYFWIYSRDGYYTKLMATQLASLKYFAPGDAVGTLSADPMIAYYKTSIEADNQNGGIEPAGPAAKLELGEETFVFGQTETEDDNNCHFIKATNTLIAGDLSTAIKSSTNESVFLRLNNIISMGIFEKQYSFTDNGTPVTEKVKGAPLEKLLEDMNLTKYMPDYADTKLSLVSKDGTSTVVSREEIKDSFVAWGYADDTATPKEQTGDLAVYLPRAHKKDAVLYNLKWINVIDASGETITEVPQIPAPGAPGSLTAVKSSYNSVKLNWKKTSDVAGYYLYRYNSKTKVWQKIKTISAAATTCTDTGLAVNTTYRYKVKSYITVNKKAYESAFSKEASAKPTLNRTSITKLSKSGKSAVKIKWKKVAGATGYQIYRSGKKSKGYKKAVTVKKGTTTTCKNKKVKKGTTYYYKVRPYRTVNGKAQYGSFSAVKKIKS